MPQLAVEGLDYARNGLADAVSSGEQRQGSTLRVGTPGIDKVARMAVVAAGQRLPEPRRCPGCPAPKPRCVGWRAQRSAKATPCASCDPQTSIFHRVPPLPSACVTLFSAVAGVTTGLTATLFLPAWQSCCAPRQWPGRCCATSCVLAATGLPVHTAELFPPPPAGQSLGGRRLCLDTWPAHRCGRCDGFAHWRTWRVMLRVNHSSSYPSHLELTHYPIRMLYVTR